MAKMPGQFKTDDIPKSEFDVLPKDEYLLEIVDSEIKHTKKALAAKDDGDEDWENVGQQAVLKMKVVGGAFDGRILWERINIINRASASAVEIGQRTWKAIRDAVGVGIVDDTAAVHSKRLVAKVDVKAETKDNPASNEIKGYKSAEGYIVKPVTKTGAAQPKPPQTKETKTANPPAAGVKKTWQKDKPTEEQPTSESENGAESED